MSTIAVIAIVVGAVLLLLFVGGYVAARRRVSHDDLSEQIRAADRALEHARASDRGWDRDHLATAAGAAIRTQRPEFEWQTIELVLVDDRPGVTEDRCHVLASGPHGSVRVILARGEGGEWFAQEVG
jgi:type II secretory pathway pseudopilin PulG